MPIPTSWAVPIQGSVWMARESATLSLTRELAAKSEGQNS